MFIQKILLFGFSIVTILKQTHANETSAHCIKMTPQKEIEIAEMIDKIDTFLVDLASQYIQFDIKTVTFEIENHDKNETEKDTDLKVTINDCDHYNNTSNKTTDDQIKVTTENTTTLSTASVEQIVEESTTDPCYDEDESVEPAPNNYESSGEYYEYYDNYNGGNQLKIKPKTRDHKLKKKRRYKIKNNDHDHTRSRPELKVLYIEDPKAELYKKIEKEKKRSHRKKSHSRQDIVIINKK